MDDRAGPRLTAAILEAVDNQLRDSNPPEVKKTYHRLVAQGYSTEEARRLIGAVLSSEVYAVLKDKNRYNSKRYVGAVRKLL